MRYSFKRAIYRRFKNETKRNDRFGWPGNRREKTSNYKHVKSNTFTNPDVHNLNGEPGNISKFVGWTVAVLRIPFILVYALIKTLMENNKKTKNIDTGTNNNEKTIIDNKSLRNNTVNNSI